MKSFLTFITICRLNGIRPFGIQIILWLYSVLIVWNEVTFFISLAIIGYKKVSIIYTYDYVTYRYWFKANLYIAIFNFAGNYFGSEYFFDVLGMVYEDLANVFTSDMFHMGGDEVKFDCWKASQEV